MKQLTIEWRHLDKDGKTCDRCSDTGETVRNAHETLVKELHPKGWEVTLKEILLTENEIPESNTIFFNGIPIEQLLPNARKSENCCTSCGELLGSPTMCRTIERYGQTYEAIPAALILEAANLYIQKHEGGI
ncbi:MAG: DUF2703 domain-containing protein [Desulfobacterales bacterium]|jgi:hypothetical protein|nr:DUF2703 domain-containing protein [Desulfobacterales bacterium]